MMMRGFLLAEGVRERVLAHARAGYPEEVCGLLVGRGEAVFDGFSTENSADLREKRGNFVISPRDYLRVEREARERGWEVVGCYHSHPDHPAVPSEKDRALGWEGWLYVIVGVTREGAGEMRGWWLGREGFGEVGV